MDDLKFKAYPKPWEIAVSKFLAPTLGAIQLGVIVYGVILLCATIINWIQIICLVAILTAINFCFKNVRGILVVVKDDDNSSR